MPTEEEIAEFMKTPEGALELQRILEVLRDSPPGISDIEEQDRLVGSEVFPSIKALPGDQLLPGGGEVPRGSGINPMEENRRRMLEQLMPSRGRGLGLGY